MCGIRIVTPCVGVWIEIESQIVWKMTAEAVTPCVGVWIEIIGKRKAWIPYESLPAWECGLKLICYLTFYPLLRHSLRGSVD